MTVYAYTAPGATYPEYINVSLDGDHVVFSVRSAPSLDVMQSDNPPLAVCGSTSVIRLPIDKADALVSDLSSALHDREVKIDEAAAS